MKAHLLIYSKSEIRWSGWPLDPEPADNGIKKSRSLLVPDRKSTQRLMHESAKENNHHIISDV